MQIVSGAAVIWSRVPAVSLSAHAASWLCCCAGCFDVCNSAACGVVAVVAVHSCSFWTFNKEKKRKALNERESQSNSHAHKTPISGCHLAPRLVFMLVVSVGEFVLFMVSCLFSLLSSSISILFCFTLASFPPLLHLSLFCSLHCDCPPCVPRLGVFLLCLWPSTPWTSPDLDYDFPQSDLLDCVWTDYLVLTRACLTGLTVWPTYGKYIGLNPARSEMILMFLAQDMTGWGLRYFVLYLVIHCSLFLPLSYINLNSLLSNLY